MGIWSDAAGMAAKTPAARNRYVDFLRAVSILFVVVGHWLVATVYVAGGQIKPDHLLGSHPQTHWLTWLFQVMPVFFIVGGYANAVSLESASRKGIGYAGWLAARLNRLVSPLLVLLAAWIVIALAQHLAGFDSATIRLTSRSALIPTWFLAVYIMLVVLAPAAYAFWQRLGLASVALLAGLAVLTDLLFFLADLRWLGWSNYFWVWLAVHQLGFAWRADRLGRPAALLVYSAAAFALLYALVALGPYPLAMVSSPEEGVSNVLPPKVTLLVLGVGQMGLLLALEQQMRRALDRLSLWTATVLINSMIMTIYLWHMTVMIAFVAVLFYAGGFGLGIEPGSSEWWFSRPLWVAALLLLLLPVAVLLSPLERRSRGTDRAPPSGSRQVIGAMMISLGLAVLAMHGFRADTLQNVLPLVLVSAGAAAGGLLPGFR